ncbi:hypothetical protein T03_14195 [Trichinella britovi]|uniref:Uncharacterized protein n=1 Tax=Trichinella britovi TaxID=45882 RepID=A0A0V1D357_TRIBR|nr:hypothetical protein T03_14195 [Trichinella britovi]
MFTSFGSKFCITNIRKYLQLDRTVFGAVTFPSCSSVVSLIIKQISLSQSSSVRSNPDNVLVLVAVSAFPICGVRHSMKLVPFATRVRMDVKAFPSRPNVPLLITNSIITLRQSSSAGARIDLSSVRFQCDMTKVSK